MGSAVPSRTRFALFGSVCLLLGGVAAAVQLSLDRSRSQIVDRYDERTTSLAAFAEDSLVRVKVDHTLAAEAVLTDGLPTVRELGLYLSAVEPKSRWAVVLDSRGQLLSASTGASAEAMAAINPEAPELASSIRGEASVGGVIDGPKGPLLPIAIPLPLGHDGPRTLVDAMPVKAVDQVLNPYLTSTSTSPGARSEVVGPFGRVLASSDGTPAGSTMAENTPSGLVGPMQGSFSDGGVDSRYSAAPVEGTELLFVRSIPESSLFASVNGTRWVTWGMFAGFACAFAWILIMLMRALERRRMADIAGERERSAAQILRASSHDPVTGLPRRGPLVERLAEDLDDESDPGVAVVSIKLERHRHIRGTLGQSSSDAVMREFAKRLGSHLSPHDTLGRTDGEDFALICRGISDSEDLLAVAARIVGCARRPFVVGSRTISLDVRIGIAESEPGGDAEAMLQRADTALTEAIASEKQVEVFGEGLGALAIERLDLESQLLEAIEDGQIFLHYQPIISLGDGKIQACEALVRWNHPERGLLGAKTFVPLAEELGTIRELGKAVLRMACVQGAEWAAAGTPVVVNVNVSAHQLEDALPTAVATALNESGLEPDHLCLELTETAIAADEERATAILRALKRLRVKVAIDDFGTGYSSWSRLAGELAIDSIKVDQSFVAGIDGHLDAVVLASIIRMGAALDLNVVAEGVETTGQEKALRSLGCPSAQGFRFARPAPADEIWLTAPPRGRLAGAPVHGDLVS